MCKTLCIPSEDDFPIAAGEELCIQVVQDCSWCYHDTKHCFPGGLLKHGTYKATNPPTTYGPYLAKNAGSVRYDSPTSGPCNAKTLTAHSIVVS